MKWGIAFLIAPLALLASGTLQVFGHSWTVYNPVDWSITQDHGTPVLRLVTPRNPLPGPRRPIQFAIAETQNFGDVTVEGDVRPLQRSLMIVFSYQDASHFDYAHLSIDTAKKQSHHNGIFHVYEGERVRISSPDGPAAFPQTKHWYHVKLVHREKTGSVDVFVDGKAIPALHAVDLSLTTGKIGLGSFDETAEFKNVKISGQAAK